jgi:hypothetical protein
MTKEIPLGITILSKRRVTNVPQEVIDALKLKPTLNRREKLLWTQEGDEIIVGKGTPQSSYKKTKLRRGGRAAVPRHIFEALKMKSTPQKEERLIWIRKGDRVFVRKGTRS